MGVVGRLRADDDGQRPVDLRARPAAVVRVGNRFRRPQFGTLFHQMVPGTSAGEVREFGPFRRHTLDLVCAPEDDMLILLACLATFILAAVNRSKGGTRR